jgi:23S rRNA (uracil1939-C5)-methyltransferase
MARRKPRPPTSLRLDRLEEKQTRGLDPEGRELLVRGAPVGAVIEARPSKGGLGVRLSTITPAVDAVEPACPVFGMCGGCQLQEMPLGAQRREKDDLVARLAEVREDPTVRRHPIVGAPPAYGYRNKLELSFGPQRYETQADRDLRDAELGAELPPLRGSFLGFHPPGWFARIVPVGGCPLGSPAMQAVIAAVSARSPGPAWDTTRQTGNYRHLVIRDAGTVQDPHLVVSFVTTSTTPEAEIQALAAEVGALPGVASVLWVENDGVAEVAAGRLRAVLQGAPVLPFRLSRCALDLPYDGFFQVNTEGAELLFGVIEEALFPDGPPAAPAGLLFDLYCGVGVIGLHLARHFERVVGVELHAGSVEQARQNAVRNGVAGEWHTGPVEEVLPSLALGGARHIVVDPPRVGLHPRAAKFLATVDADVLVYVSCGPRALARDRPILQAGGWRLTDLWSVDLFPQTHHVEAVARYVKTRSPEPRA